MSRFGTLDGPPTSSRSSCRNAVTPLLLLCQVLNQTEDHRTRVLQAASKTLRVWFIKVKKMKAIYHTLNLCNIDVTQKCLIAEVWCPVSDLEAIQFALRRGTVGLPTLMLSTLSLALIGEAVMNCITAND